MYKKIGLIALLSALAITGQTRAQSVSQVPSSGPKPPGAPITMQMPWGTFKLADRIADKIRKHEPINVVYSYQASGIPLYSQQQLMGFKNGSKSHLPHELRRDRARAGGRKPAGFPDSG